MQKSTQPDEWDEKNRDFPALWVERGCSLGQVYMKILVVSGFLGAGKTTFIRELLRRAKIQGAVLENEYGEVDLDSRTVRSTGNTDVLEFMEGCVCCTQKESFINTVLTISASLDPEYLIVEPSGIGKLGSIVENILRISYERIQLLPPVLILAPRSMEAHLAEYPEIFADQLEHAGRIVLTKCEHEDRGLLDRTRELISRYNRQSPVLETPYTLQGMEWWHEVLGGDSGKKDASWLHAKIAQEGEEEGRSREASGEEQHSHGCLADGHQGHEEHQSGHHDHIHGHGEDMASPDHLTLHDGKLVCIGSLVLFLEDILHGEFGSVVRAKGTLRAGGEWLRFDVADGLYAVTGTEDAQPVTQCVFIGRGLKRDALCGRLQAAGNQLEQ